MTDDLKISDVAASFIWAQAIPKLLDGGLNGPAAVLATRPRYEGVFEGSDGPKGTDPRFKYPWPHVVGSHFWERYVGSPLDYIDGTTAWQRLLPLRERLSIPRVANEPGLNWLAEAFYYPHGIALVVTVRRRVPGTPSAIVDELQRVAGEAEVELVVDGSVLHGRLPALAAAALRALATTRDGQVGAVNWQADPFSVCTVIQATPHDPSIEIEANGDLRRALHGLASWSPTWAQDRLGAVDEVVIRRSSKPAGHILYIAERGRAVYFPSFFAETTRRRHSLTCYHRNLTFASLTAESLTALLAETDRRLAPPRRLVELSADQRELATNAFDRLVELHDAATTTYKTRSVSRQLAANGGRVLLNKLAATLGKNPLA